MSSVTAVLIVKNEATYIKRCLDSLTGYEEVVFNSLDDNLNPVGRQNSDVIGAVRNVDDVIHITILFPILSTEKREEVCYPEQIHVKKNGRVSLPNDTQNN